MDNKTLRELTSQLSNLDHGLAKAGISLRELTEELTLRDEELLRQYNLFNTLLENLQIGIFMVEVPSGKPLVANREALKIMGTEVLPSDLFYIKQYKAFKYITNEPYPEDEMPLARAMRGETSHVKNLVVERPDGVRTLIESYGSPVLDKDGKVWAALVSFIDICLRKKAEKSLIAEQLFTEAFLESVPGLLYMYDEEGNIVRWNKNHEAMTGYSAEEMSHMTPTGWYTGDDLERVGKARDKVFSDGYAEVEANLIKKDGTTILMHLNGVRLEIEGKRYFVGVGVDITETEKTKKDLFDSRVVVEETKENFSRFFESMIDMIFVADLEGNIIYNNQSALDKLEYTNEELRKRNIFSLHPLDNQQEAEEIFTAMLQGSLTICPLPLETKSGVSIPVETHIWFGKWSGIECIYATSKDLSTEQEALQKFNRLFYNNPALMAVTTYPERIFTDVNESFVHTLGYSREEIIGRTGIELNLFINSEVVGSIISKLELGQPANGIELSVRCKNGNIVEGVFSAEKIESQGEQYLLTVMIDQTDKIKATEDLKVSENRWRFALESAGEGIWDWDYKENTVYYSTLWKSMLGYDENDIGNGIEEWSNHIHHDDKKEALNKLEPFINGDDTLYRNEYRAICKDGSYKWVLAKGKVIQRDENGVPLRIIGTQTDLTEKKKDEAQRQKLESLLKQSDKMEAIGTLAGGIAHDFNNILMGIQGYISLMLIDLSPETSNYERLKLVEDQVMSGSQLTSQLLGFARGGQYEVKPIDINSVIKKTASMFGRTKQQVSIFYRLDDNLMAVEADWGQLEQVLINMYVNACQAMTINGELTLETENVILPNHLVTSDLKAGNYVKIKITDNGKGMDEQTKLRIFDPFFTTKGIGKGTGLGLAMVYGIIKSHRGLIDVDSTVGEGTSFTIYLPASDKKVIKEIEVPAGKILTGTEGVLIVDDQRMVLEAVSELLRILGYKIFAAGSGQEAVAVYMEKHREIDLIILDMIMPGISGIGTFDMLREFDPSVKILLSSGYSLNGEATNIMRKGCNGFIQKPFKLEGLSKKIRMVLDLGKTDDFKEE